MEQMNCNAAVTRGTFPLRRRTSHACVQLRTSCVQNDSAEQRAVVRVSHDGHVNSTESNLKIGFGKQESESRVDRLSLRYGTPAGAASGSRYPANRPGDLTGSHPERAKTLNHSLRASVVNKRLRWPGEAPRAAPQFH